MLLGGQRRVGWRQFFQPPPNKACQGKGAGFRIRQMCINPRSFSSWWSSTVCCLVLLSLCYQYLFHWHTARTKSILVVQGDREGVTVIENQQQQLTVVAVVIIIINLTGRQCLEETRLNAKEKLYLPLNFPGYILKKGLIIEFMQPRVA